MTSEWVTKKRGKRLPFMEPRFDNVVAEKIKGRQERDEFLRSTPPPEGDKWTKDQIKGTFGIGDTAALEYLYRLYGYPEDKMQKLEDRIQEIRTLISQGATIKEIADKMGSTTHRVHTFLKNHGMKTIKAQRLVKRLYPVVSSNGEARRRQEEKDLHPRGSTQTGLSSGYCTDVPGIPSG